MQLPPIASPDVLDPSSALPPQLCSPSAMQPGVHEPALLAAAGPIALAAGHAGVHSAGIRKMSLLTSALGANPTPIHPFLSANAPVLEPMDGAVSQGDGAGAGKLDQVLNSWDRAWMGAQALQARCSRGISNSASSSPGTSPSAQRAQRSLRGASHPALASILGQNLIATAQNGGSQAPLSIAVSPNTASDTTGHSGVLSNPISAPTGAAWVDGGLPPISSTPPHPHRTLSSHPVTLGPAHPASSGTNGGTSSYKARTSMGHGDAAPLHITSAARNTAAVGGARQAQPVPVASSSYRVGASPIPASRSITATPINVHYPVIPKGAKDSSDFASVFFSPLPYSYLAMAHSDSTEQMLGASVGSPDVTLRGGRLTASNSHSAHTGLEASLGRSASTQGLLAGASSPMCHSPLGQSLGSALHGSLGGSSNGEDTALHKRIKQDATASPGSSASPHQGGLASGLTLLQMAEAAAGAGACDASASPSSPKAQVHLITTSPDSVLEHAPLDYKPTVAPKATSSNGVGVAVERTAAVSSVGVASGRPAAVNGGGLGSSGLLRAGSAGLKTVSGHPFTHPSMGSLLTHSITVAPQANQGFPSIARSVQEPHSCALRLVAGAAMIPHLEKAEKGGEDAYCIVPVGLGSIGVADGVSGWAEEGIDPAEYSRTLMRYCAEAMQEAGVVGADAREIIRYAHGSTVMPGSATVCLALMKPTGRLQVANLGDSGVRVIRDGRIIFASAAQQHMFNMPYQLSHPSIIDSPDDADSADVTLLDVMPGDCIVMATDGLYDNMFDEEIAAICGEAVSRRRRALMMLAAGGDAPPSPKDVAAALAASDGGSLNFGPQHAEGLAQQIARTAHRYAQDPYQRTPWSVASCEQGFAWAKYFAKGGGKMDDCTVIVSFIQPDIPYSS